MAAELIANSQLSSQHNSLYSSLPQFSVQLSVEQLSAEVQQLSAEIGAQRMTIMPKLEHGAFVALLRGADFVVTDSGGIQEESAVFGIPTLIHRMATERSEGLGTSALLSRWDTATVRRFVADPSPWRTVDDVTESSPSTIVVDDLVARGFAGV